jgi:hypothetical protein
VKCVVGFRSFLTTAWAARLEQVLTGNGILHIAHNLAHELLERMRARRAKAPFAGSIRVDVNGSFLIQLGFVLLGPLG